MICTERKASRGAPHHPAQQEKEWEEAWEAWEQGAQAAPPSSTLGGQTAPTAAWTLPAQQTYLPACLGSTGTRLVGVVLVVVPLEAAVQAPAAVCACFRARAAPADMGWRTCLVMVVAAMEGRDQLAAARQGLPGAEEVRDVVVVAVVVVVVVVTAGAGGGAVVVDVVVGAAEAIAIAGGAVAAAVTAASAAVAPWCWRNHSLVLSPLPLPP